MIVWITRALERALAMTRPHKKMLVLATDLALLLVATLLAYSIRMGVWIYYGHPVRTLFLASAIVMVPVFLSTGVYRAIFRFLGAGMIGTLTRAFTIYFAAILAIFLFWGVPHVPRSLAVMQPLIFFTLVLCSRALGQYMVFEFIRRRRFAGPVKSVLVYGAGAAGQQLVGSMRSEPGIRVVGFVDDDRRLHNQKLDGHRVIHSDELEAAIARTGATDVLLALPSAGRSRRHEIIRRLGAMNVQVSTLPPLRDIVGGSISFSDLHPIEIEDLLGREPVRPNELLLGRTIVGRSVMVTGAGGSIGSELCRQIVAIGARKLVLFEMSEFALYRIHRELDLHLPDDGARRLELVPVLGSVLDSERLDEVLAAHAVDTVYHAAAYKHVPLVEANPVEGIRNNVIGTFRMADAVRRAGVKDFILVSTDKAVRPTNVMGASKRGAELAVQALAAKKTDTCFSMVRFGNVLGSSGSVVPLFRSQLEAGGPITLTHREITRYFMTIPEAANLVIQAAGLARGGEVFVLDMGQPIRIYDLAHTMVRLAGLAVRDAENPDGDIEIVEVGLRKGEKLYEELLIGEKPEQTKHPRILMAREDHLPWAELEPLLAGFDASLSPAEGIALLQALVKEFEHDRDNRRIETASA